MGKAGFCQNANLDDDTDWSCLAFGNPDFYAIFRQLAHMFFLP